MTEDPGQHSAPLEGAPTASEYVPPPYPGYSPSPNAPYAPPNAGYGMPPAAPPGYPSPPSAYPPPPSGYPSAPSGYPPAPGYPAANAVGYPAQSGPVAKPRNIWACVGLAIITLGIYGWFWTWRTHEEMKVHTGNGVGGPVGFLIYLVVAPVTFFLLPGEVRQMVERSGQTSRVKGTTGFWILLPLAGPLVWFVKVQGQLNDYWRSQGAVG